MTPPCTIGEASSSGRDGISRPLGFVHVVAACSCRKRTATHRNTTWRRQRSLPTCLDGDRHSVALRPRGQHGRRRYPSREEASSASPGRCVLSETRCSKWSLRQFSIHPVSTRNALVLDPARSGCSREVRFSGVPTSNENADSTEGEAWKIASLSLDRMLAPAFPSASSVQPIRRT